MIFVRAMLDGLTVAEVNERAQMVSSSAEHDADIFIALVNGYLTLSPPAR